MPLATVEIDAEDAVGSVLWLHGLGADGHDFEPIVPLLPLAVPLRFVFPHAPERAVTINGGTRMRAWYDIDPRAPLAGTEHIRTAAAQVAELVAAEAERGVVQEKVVLAGFSQGGVVALHLALRTERPFAGVMALSTYVHDHEHLGDQISLAGVEVPILMAHGQQDPMIPLSRAVTSRDAMTSLGCQVDWREYGMGHQVCPQEIDDIGQWLNGIFG